MEITVTKVITINNHIDRIGAASFFAANYLADVDYTYSYVPGSLFPAALLSERRMLFLAQQALCAGW